jgi:hypothetical protein
VVEVVGTNFVKGSLVRINGVGRETEFVGSTRLRAKLLAEDVERESELVVNVVNPPPGGGVSGALRMRVTAAIAGAAAPPAHVHNDDTEDGCDADAAANVMPDEALPPAEGGVKQS